ncbi:hypothetical protein EVAR_50423_1 [Eumeta japonica]|uniref:Uncharacterized protein n=1 Tax=Eumeta variegata TaxID=151549 RepID=A0A4C1WU81_EUMVA|nr:hypothetical protein EVAR_50423_1 [Eumeta japonica]
MPTSLIDGATGCQILHHSTDRYENWYPLVFFTENIFTASSVTLCWRVRRPTAVYPKSVAHRHVLRVEMRRSPVPGTPMVDVLRQNAFLNNILTKGSHHILQLIVVNHTITCLAVGSDISSSHQTMPCTALSSTVVVFIQRFHSTSRFALQGVATSRWHLHKAECQGTVLPIHLPLLYRTNRLDVTKAGGGEYARHGQCASDIIFFYDYANCASDKPRSSRERRPRPRPARKSVPHFSTGTDSRMLKVYFVVWSCWTPIDRVPRWWIGEYPPDMGGTGEIKYSARTKTSRHGRALSPVRRGLRDHTPTEKTKLWIS